MTRFFAVGKETTARGKSSQIHQMIWNQRNVQRCEQTL